jgi:tryptophanyl-tRNA synthetase
MLKVITKQLDALDSSSKKRQISQIVNKCEETLGSDVSIKKNVLEEIEQQLSSVSLSRQKIKQAKRHETLS